MNLRIYSQVTKLNSVNTFILQGSSNNDIPDQSIILIDQYLILMSELPLHVEYIDNSQQNIFYLCGRPYLIPIYYFVLLIIFTTGSFYLSPESVDEFCKQ